MSSARRWRWASVLPALVPVLSLGLLCAVPSLVIAVRRRRLGDWAVFGGFLLVNLLWLVDLGMTPDRTRGIDFLFDLVLVLLSTAGAALHCLLAWGPRAGVAK